MSKLKLVFFKAPPSFHNDRCAPSPTFTVSKRKSISGNKFIFLPKYFRNCKLLLIFPLYTPHLHPPIIHSSPSVYQLPCFHSFFRFTRLYNRPKRIMLMQIWRGTNGIYLWDDVSGSLILRRPRSFAVPSLLSLSRLIYWGPYDPTRRRP